MLAADPLLELTVGRRVVPADAWAPSAVEMSGGMVGHLLAWEKIEGDDSLWAWVSWVQETAGWRVHQVVQVQAASLRPLEPPEAYKQVPRRVLGLDGQPQDDRPRGRP